MIDCVQLNGVVCLHVTRKIVSDDTLQVTKSDSLVSTALQYPNFTIIPFSLVRFFYIYIDGIRFFEVIEQQSE